MLPHVDSEGMMAGRVIRIVPLTDYDWGGVAKGAEVRIVVAKQVDVSQYRHATLAVRAHSLTVPGDGTLAVQAVPVGHTQEDPATEFFDTDAMQAVSMISTDSAPFYRTLELTAGRTGAMIAIAISATMDSVQAQPMDAKLSIDLVLKE